MGSECGSTSGDYQCELPAWHTGPHAMYVTMFDKVMWKEVNEDAD